MKIEIDSVEKTVKLLDDNTNLKELLDIIDAFSAEDELEKWKIIKPLAGSTWQNIGATSGYSNTIFNSETATSPPYRMSTGIVEPSPPYAAPNITMTTTRAGTTTTRTMSDGTELFTTTPARTTRRPASPSPITYTRSPGGVTMSVADYLNQVTNTGIAPIVSE